MTFKICLNIFSRILANVCPWLCLNLCYDRVIPGPDSLVWRHSTPGRGAGPPSLAGPGNKTNIWICGERIRMTEWRSFPVTWDQFPGLLGAISGLWGWDIFLNVSSSGDRGEEIRGDNTQETWEEPPLRCVRRSRRLQNKARILDFLGKGVLWNYSGSFGDFVWSYLTLSCDVVYMLWCF